MLGQIQLLGKLASFLLLAYFLYRSLNKSDKPAALILMLGLMIIAEDYAEKAIYLPGVPFGSIRFSEVIIIYLLFKESQNKENIGKRNIIDVLWIPYIILFLVSIARSDYPFDAMKNFRFSVLDPFLIYLIACKGFKSEEDYKRFVVYLGILVFILSAASIDDLKFHTIWFRSDQRSRFEYWGTDSIGRYGSFFLNPNFFASFLILSLPVMAFTVFDYKSYAKPFMLILFLTGILALIITYTRASYVAIFAGAIFSINYGLLKIVKLKQLILIMIVLIGGVGLIFPGAYDKIVNRADTIQEEKDVSRVALWRNALKLLARNPLVGIGFSEADYKLEAMRYTNQDVTKKKSGQIVEGFMDQPHNSYISLALWVSPLSVIIFLVMNYNLIRVGKKIINNPISSPFLKILSFGIGISIFCYLVIIFFDTQLLLRSVNSLYWILFGLLISIFNRVCFSKS